MTNEQEIKELLNDAEIAILARDVTDLFLKHAIASGFLILNGKSPEQEFESCTKYLREWISLKGEISFITDYRDDILRKARLEKRKKEWEMSALLYATFIEHSLNHLIEVQCSRASIEADMARQIMRDVNLAGKLSWLPRLLSTPALDKRHRDALINICNLRNSFVHYKWNYNPDEQNPLEKAVTQIETHIKAFRRYSERIIFGSQLAYLRKSTKKVKESLNIHKRVRR